LTICKTNEEFGQYCLKHTHPEFRARAKDGYNVVVAGQAFGCGSSRENAVNALLGVGIICVIARSFAFIYGRNQPNLGLLGITITDDSFYEAAADGASIDVDLDDTKVRIGEKEWSFQFSKMERELTQAGGLSNAFRKFGGKLFEIMCAPTKIQAPVVAADDGCGNSKGLEW
jgi:3-isopropylmalate dehydratase small subunit